ncbi:hypothetical protein CONPUDRAFT_144499 [Coniophora puteana RWD-64-598 SS2]|uniref:Class I glutamine amidotransferase-like protein n=1 Tax=Coniophora puteana (strain RWD-64-598) TaxID=741705 RepID=A0A5M3MP36_CONPW|nr:uncharacterized protein CONPUDRAFT_144499 [Coniophora puteana RWD-64-598 SS2]EIW80401.1 hypothetical protein CONPUDRAFT_144499 [Coniophora puteana RWD-64-598 SS2]
MPSPQPLRVAVFSCGPVEGRMKTELGFTAGAEGTREIFHKFLIENPRVANPLDPNQKIFNPELAVIANGLQTIVYDVLGDGEPVPTDAPIFDENDPRLPSEDALDTIDAIFVSGSGTSVRYVEDPIKRGQWEGKIRRVQRYLRFVIDNHPRIKVVGICFGHQILSFASGHAVDRNPKGWEVGPKNVTMTDLGKSVFQKGVLVIQQLHQDHVLLNVEVGGIGDSGSGGYGATPRSGSTRSSDEVVIDRDITPLDGLSRWGQSDLTWNQGMIKIPEDVVDDLDDPKLHLEALEKVHIFTSQGHPELDRDMIRVLIEDEMEPYVSGGIPADRALAALARNEDKNIEINVDDLAIVCWQMLKGAWDAKNAA